MLPRLALELELELQNLNLICGIYYLTSLTSVMHSEGYFCFRFVFSPGELTEEGGWAGVKVAPAS